MSNSKCLSGLDNVLTSVGAILNVVLVQFGFFTDGRKTIQDYSRCIFDICTWGHGQPKHLEKGGEVECEAGEL